MTERADQLGNPTREHILGTVHRIVAGLMNIAPNELDVHHSLLDIGVTSLMLMDAIRQIQDIFGVRPAPRKILEQFWTIARASDYIVELLADKSQRSSTPIDDGSSSRTLFRGQINRMPLLAMQRQMEFFAYLAEQAAAAYRETLVLSLRGTLDMTALNEALAGIIERHAALRTRLVAEYDVQEIASAAVYPVAFVDFSSFDAKEVQRRAAAWHETEAQKNFDPAKPLLDVTVLKLNADFSLLVLSAHAAIADRCALYRIADELATMYSAIVRHVDHHLPDAISYETHIAERVTRERNGGFQAAESYWSDRYRQGVPRLELPADKPRPPMQSYRGARLSVPVALSLVRSLQTIAEDLGASLQQLSLAAFAVLLSRLTGEQRIVIGASEHPTKADSFPLVANRKNLLPCLFTVDDEQPFSDWFRVVWQDQKNAQGHFELPLALLVDRLKPERDLARSPLFVVAFEVEHVPTPPMFAKLEVAIVTAAVQHVRYDLHLTLVEMGDSAHLRCDFSTDLFERQTVRRWLAILKEMMSAIAEAPSVPIHALPALLEEDRRLIDTWNATNADIPRDSCIHQMFERHAARTPHAIAAICGDRQLTYAELDVRANQLAHHLRHQGIGPDVPVGIYSDRSLEMLVGLLGILKAGGAYVPLDPTYPAQRIGFMVEDAALSVIVTRPHLTGQLPEHRARVISLDLEQWELSHEPTTTPPSGVGPSNIAYLIYTSGSTGKPKGVEVPHLGAVNVLADSERVYGLDATDIVVAVTTISFDISVAELFLGLAVGARVVIVPDDIAADAARLRELLENSGTTFFQATPSRFQALLDNDWNGSSVKAVCGGDVLRDALADRLVAKTKALWNIYGPTEATIWSTRAQLVSGSGVTIGRPLANTQIHIVDQRLQPVPIGVPGELCIGGVGVARGYHQRPDLTQEKFIADKFHAAPGARLYRTGDLARFRQNGDIEFLGRIDHQIKLRGYRIELGEIDSILQRHPAVRQCVTIVRTGPAGDYLVSYFVPSEPSPSLPVELREMLRENVPEYMIPTVFVALEALPLTSNGKIDRGALPAPREADRGLQTQGDTGPRNSIEQFLVKTWSEMLGIARIGIHDDFFALGGHSLLITRIVLLIRQQFQVGVGPRDFFETPTIAKLGSLIAEKRHEHLPREVALSRKNTVARERFDFLRRDAVLDPTIVPALPAHEPGARPAHVLLTGATGFVGAYVVRALLDRSSAMIHCLVRAASPDEGRVRIVKNLERWNLAKPGDGQRITAVLGDLTRVGLGLDKTSYDALAMRLDLIIHSAANVNFVYPYRVLRPVNVGGTQEIIRLAASGRAKPLHYVSTAAVFPMGHPEVLREDSSLDQNTLLNLAYDESKWVAEHLLQEAARRGLPVAIHRMGEICGDSRTGQTIAEHMIYALCKGCIQLELFPDLDPSIDLVPVDYVSNALVHIALQPGSTGRAYHLNNPEPTDQASTYGWIREQGYRFDVVPYDEWRHRLLTHPDVANNALYPFVGLFEDFEADNLRFPLFDASNTKARLAGSDVSCVPTFDMLPVMFGYFQSSGFLPMPPGHG